MNESPIRRFCESTHRKLIVVIVTTLVGLAVLIPLADDYFDKKESRRTLAEELDSARQTVASLPTYEQRANEMTQQLGEYEARSVSQQSVSEYRSKLVNLIRDSNCQMRRLDLGTPTSRPWLENDNPLKRPIVQGTKVKKTPFTLERRSVVLLVDGTMDSIRSLLDKLHEDETFAYPSRLNLHAAGRQGGTVTLELELWLFALGRSKAT